MSRVFATFLAIGLLCGVGGGAAVARLAGLEGRTVRSGSMAPALDAGDVIVNERIRPLEARVGDIVTFSDPGRRSRRITHRVRGIHRRAGDVEFATKGDANATAERWSIGSGASVGRAVARIPHAGHLLSWLATPGGRIGLLIVPALLLCTVELRRIWRAPARGRARRAG